MGKLTYLNHLKACAEAAKSFTNGLVAKLAQTVTEAMQEMEDVKADKQNTKAITIPTTGWGIDENSEDYPSYCDIVVAGITAKDRVDIAIAPNSQAAAVAAGVSDQPARWRGRSAIWAKTAPAAAISAEYWLNQGKE